MDLVHDALASFLASPRYRDLVMPEPRLRAVLGGFLGRTAANVAHKRTRRRALWDPVARALPAHAAALGWRDSTPAPRGSRHYA